MPVVRDNAEPLAIVFRDDGLVPNNSLPFLVYQSAVKLDSGRPEETIENLFERNGWGGTWRNGVYAYLHYHATVHEVLGVARGSASVRFGRDRRWRSRGRRPRTTPGRARRLRKSRCRRPIR